MHNRALVGEALEIVATGLGAALDAAGDRRGSATGQPPPQERDMVALLGWVATPDAPRADAPAGGGAFDLVTETPVDPTAAYAHELRAVWDAWARFRPFDDADTLRALDTAARLLRALEAEADAARVQELATVPLALVAARVLSGRVAEEGVDPESDAVRDSAQKHADAEPHATTRAIDLDADEVTADASPVPAPAPAESALPGAYESTGEDVTQPVRLRAVPRPAASPRADDAHAPASIRALRAVDPALPLVTWSELSDTITALLGAGRLDPHVLETFTRRSLDERARAAVERADARGSVIRAEHVVWVVSVLRSRYTGTGRVTRAAATALVAEHIAALAPRAGVDPRRVRQDMMAWVDVERA